MSTKKLKPQASPCRICGSSAVYSYFGVISCHPCKMFFKRNALSLKQSLICNFDGLCEININNRHVCSACRLAKCFSTGMKVEMMRLSSKREPHINKSKKEISTEIFNIETIPIVNLLEKENSSLDRNEWALLTNITNSYDESKLFLTSQHLQSEHDSSRCLVTINEELVRKYIVSIYESSGIFIGRNSDISNLSSNSRSIILHTAADNVTCLMSSFTLYHSHLFQHKALTNFLASQYGKIEVDYYCWSTKFTPLDSVLFKLGLSLFAFSLNARIFHRDMCIEFDNLGEILEIQNKYAELTWKYLIYRYGYHEAIRKFTILIQWFLSATVLISYAHNTETHANDIDSLIEQAELTFILDDAEKMVTTN
ncbi:unnamed protein product [Rotaria socialis]